MMKRWSFLVALGALAACSSSGGAADSGDNSEASTGDAAIESGADSGGITCTAALNQMLNPIDMVSTGTVSVLSDQNGVKTVFIDATAGGISSQDQNPRVYVRLDTGARVDVTDVSARSSTAWDLAFKRPIIFTNGGVAGPGLGGAAVVSKAFDQVTAADVPAKFPTEAMVDADCNPQTDATGAPKTTFTDWYGYDQMTNQVAPKPNRTYVVKSGGGKNYKVAILSYYGTMQGVDGGLSGGPSGQYIIQVGAL